MPTDPLQTWRPDIIARYRQLLQAGTPYVWLLRLSLDDFNALEQAVRQSLEQHPGDASYLVMPDYALQTVVYLAEWYKRCYGSKQRGDKALVKFDTPQLKALYQSAGIDSQTYVYDASQNPDRPSRRWQESLQVLGGMAIQAELWREVNKNKSAKLLLALCRAYHGEDVDLSLFIDRDRAVAFQESIRRQHSLYHFLYAILDDHPEAAFAKSDLDSDPSVKLLLDMIRTADQQAKRDKFDFEWIVQIVRSERRFTRQLRIHLKPEHLGGKPNTYLSYQRLRQKPWGIAHPENIGRLLFFLRFRNGGTVIHQTPVLFRFDTTNDEEKGFILIGVPENIVCKDVPVELFDRVDLVVSYVDDDTYHERTVQKLDVKQYMQLYHVPRTSSLYSSRTNHKASNTAVLFSPRYHLAEGFESLTVTYAPFRNGDQQSEDYCWCDINDKVIIADEEGHEVMPPFFNRNGLYQVLIKKYLDTIRYKDNVYVTYRYIDPEYDPDERQQRPIPVLFGRSGLEVLHFDTGQSATGEPVTDYCLEWKDLDRGNYQVWDDDHEPQQGYITLRVTVKGLEKHFPVYYVPFSPSAVAPEPIRRDFEHQRICSAIDQVDDIQDSFSKDPTVDEPDTLPLFIGADDAQIELDVYRPIKLRELSERQADGMMKVVDYKDEHHDVRIPLLCADRFALRVFSEQGVCRWTLHPDQRWYSHLPDYTDQRANKDASLTKEYPLSLLAPDVPLDYVKIYVTRAVAEKINLYAWTYGEKPEPTSNYQREDVDIVFQSLKDDPAPRHYIKPHFREKDIFDELFDDGVEEKVDALQVFETAKLHGTYYFLFEPLLDIVREHRETAEILFPLIRKRSYQLTDVDVAALRRFCWELKLDWMTQSDDAWAAAIAAFTDSDDEAAKIGSAIRDLRVRMASTTN